MQILKLLMLFSMIAPIAQAKTITFNQARSVELIGEINSETLNKANQLVALAADSTDPIDVLIASPGGVISYGLYFIEAMKTVQAKGVKVRCFVPQLAASMAFTIFTQCSERMALPYARLLFHSPRIGGEFLLTPQSAIQLAQGLMGIEQVLLKLIIPAMSVTKEVGGEWFVTSYLDERLFIAGDLLKESPKPWFKIIDRLEGCTNPFKDPWAQGATNMESAEFIYVYER